MDLERRSIVDVLSDRSTASLARWLKEHPTVKVVSRDRCGLPTRHALSWYPA
uniref:hypothetical protein n=1 Tax=Acidisoma silvae TaxID=2802396 RepID=UPI0029CABB65|nr:hypothetical protein [Acidisoma silvae]